MERRGITELRLLLLPGFCAGFNYLLSGYSTISTNRANGGMSFLASKCSFLTNNCSHYLANGQKVNSGAVMNVLLVILGAGGRTLHHALQLINTLRKYTT